jgi:Tfp pilus assembly PilM family ATPase
MSWFSGFSSGGPCSHKRIVVLDGDERTVRLLSARAGRNGIRVDGAVESEFPAELDLTDAEAVGRFVDELRVKAEIAPAAGVTGLSAHQAGRHEMNLPVAPEAELWPMALMQARREQHLDNMATDFCLLSAPTESPAKVLAAAVHNDILNRTRTILRAAGCTADAVGLRPIAAVRAAGAAGIAFGDVPGALVDVGKSHTEITLLEGGRIVASRAASAGYGYAGAAVDEPADAPADPAVVEGRWIENLAQELQRTLLAYGGAARSGPPRRIYLSLRSDLAQKPAEFLRARGLDVVVVDPLAAIESSADAAARLRSGNFTAAVGLATQYLLDRNLPVDFEHPKLQRAEQLGRDQARVRRLAIAFAAVAAMVLPTPLWWSRNSAAAGLRSDRDFHQMQEKSAKRDTEKYRLFRDIWLDKAVRPTDPSLQTDVNAELKTQKEFRDQLEELRRRREQLKLEEGPWRIADNERKEAQKELDSYRSRAVAERRFDTAKALREVYTACEAIFKTEDGGGKHGRLIEFRLEPRTGPVGAAAPAAGKAGYPVAVKFRVMTGRMTQDFVDELNRNGEAQTVREQSVTGKDDLKVEAEVGYRPSFVLGDGSRPAVKTPAGKAGSAPTSGKKGRP